MKQIILALILLSSISSFASTIDIIGGKTNGCDTLEVMSKMLNVEGIQIDITSCREVQKDNLFIHTIAYETSDSYIKGCNKFSIVRIRPQSKNINPQNFQRFLHDSGIELIARTDGLYTDINQGKYLLVLGVPEC